MTDHLNPKPSEVMERSQFYKARQEQGVAEFAARLKKLSLNCNFPNLSDFLRDQLVCGLCDQETKVKLFETESLTYDSALKGAIMHETALNNASNSSTSDRKTFQRDVLAIDSPRTETRHQNSKPSYRGKSHIPASSRQ